jgi:uncharacterized protein (TIGR03435 family)
MNRRRIEWLQSWLSAVVLWMSLMPWIGLAQTPSTAMPGFEVATIRPSSPDAQGSNLNFGENRVTASNMQLRFLLQYAYGLNTGSNDQIVGAPAWIDSLRFDIDAKEDEESAVKIGGMAAAERMATLRQMLQGLLIERFQLKAHHETRQLPVLALTVAKGGAKLTPVGAVAPDGWTGLHNPRRGETEGRDVPVQMLVETLSSKPEIGGRLVVDATGLQGKYNFKLDWTPEGTKARDADAGGPSLFAALQEQLGLKLESRKAPVDCLVIDHLVQPSGN